MASPITIDRYSIHTSWKYWGKLDYSDLFISDFHLANLLIQNTKKLTWKIAKILFKICLPIEDWPMFGPTILD